ncbi:MAG TPA: alpha/beta fold hydrolase [Acidimicrobiales bacterium]|nr:alpha/beta fold hydrolase [Acidimicrobiales bacterium]
MPLPVDRRGDGPPLVLVHGFTQTGRLWGRFGDILAGSHSLLAPDLPGHAGADAVRANLEQTAGLVADATRAAIGDEPCDLLGYSLGARVALHVVATTSLAVRHLVLVGGTAGIEDDGARDQRRRADEAMADDLEASGDVDAFLERWLSTPMFRRLAAMDEDGRDERRRNSAAGLASSLRLCGTGTQDPLWDRLPSVPTPLLAIAGADDSRFAAHAARMAALAPRGAATLLPGGGHAAHLAQPEQAARLVRHWLTEVDPAVSS